jgi:hypothetical protein
MTPPTPESQRQESPRLPDDRLTEEVRSFVFETLHSIGAGTLENAFANVSPGSIDADRFVAVLAEHRLRPVPPPEHVRRAIDIYRVDGATRPSWNVDAPLWTTHGQSDWTIKLFIQLIDGVLRASSIDIRVL